MRKINKSGIRFSVKVLKDGEVVSKYSGGKYGRFLHRTQAADWRKHGFEVTIRFDYGYDYDIDGNYVKFQNEGTYANKKDLRKAIEAFMDVGRV